MKYNIAIIGAGQLGSRHLQGVLKSSFEFDVYVIDPYRGSLELAQSRASEIEHNHVLNFEESITALPTQLDLVIVATNSDVRLSVLKQLIDHSKVATLILEKVLFQSLHEYDEALELFKKTNTKIFVNHVRRMQEIYRGLHKVLEEFKDEVFDAEYYGANWGLGTSGLHLSDALSFLLNDSIMHYESRELDSEILESKRNGFVELTGTLSGKTTNGHSFRITSSRTEDGLPSVISLKLNAPSVRITLIEGGNKPSLMVTRMNQGANTEFITFPQMLFQSDLSKIIVEEALSGKTLQLTNYEDAMTNHKLFIKSLLNHLNQSNSEKSNRCAIT